MQFHIFILFRFLCNKRCFKVMFRVLDEKPTHKHVLRRQMTEIGNLTLRPQMILNSEKVTSGLGRCLDMPQTRIMSIHRLLIRLFSEFCENKRREFCENFARILRRKGNKWKMSNILCLT